RRCTRRARSRISSAPPPRWRQPARAPAAAAASWCSPAATDRTWRAFRRSIAPFARAAARCPTSRSLPAARSARSRATGAGAARRAVPRPVASTATTDGREHAARAYSLVVASVVENLGLHMHVLYRATERPDRLHLVASPLGAQRLGPQMPLVLAGRRLL